MTGGMHKFFKNLLQNSMHQKCDVKPVPYWWPTNIRYYHTKCSCSDDLAHRISAPLYKSVWKCNKNLHLSKLKGDFNLWNL